MTLVYFFVNNGVLQHGTVDLVAAPPAVGRFLMLLGVGR